MTHTLSSRSVSLRAIVLLALGALTLAYLVLYPNLAASLLPSHALGLVTFVLMGGGLLALGIGMMRAPARLDAILMRVKALPRPLVWLIALVFTLPMLQAANVLQVTFNALTLIPLYAVVLLTALGLVAWREWGERGALPLDAGRDSRRALRLALIFALLTLAANYFVIWGFHISSGVDMARYTIWGQKLFDPTVTEQILLWDSFPYLLIHNLTRSEQSPVGIMSANALLMTLAVFAFTYVIARRNVWLAGCIGLALALDFTWLAANRGVQTEGPTSASLILTLALLTYYVTTSKPSRKLTLFLLGGVYAFMLAIRVSNLVLLFPIGFVYGFNKRMRSKVVYLVLGFLIVIIGFMGFNLWRYGTPSLSQATSVNFDASLFIVGMFEPSNGEISQDYQARLLRCYPEIAADDYDFRRFLARQTEEYPYTFLRDPDVIACLGIDTQVYSRLMFEAIRAKPLDFIYTQFAQNSAAFALAFDPVIVTEKTLIGFSNVLPMKSRFDICEWCVNFINREQLLDIQHPFWQGMANIYSALRQPYLLWGVQPNVPQYMGNLPVQSPHGVTINRYEQWFYRDSDYCTGDQPCISLSVAVAWFLWLGFVFTITRKWMRFVVGMAALFIHLLLGLATVGFMFEARYALAYMPLMLLIGVIGWVTIGAGVWQLFTQKEGKQA